MSPDTFCSITEAPTGVNGSFSGFLFSQPQAAAGTIENVGDSVDLTITLTNVIATVYRDNESPLLVNCGIKPPTGAFVDAYKLLQGSGQFCTFYANTPENGQYGGFPNSSIEAASSWLETYRGRDAHIDITVEPVNGPDGQEIGVEATMRNFNDAEEYTTIGCANLSSLDLPNIPQEIEQRMQKLGEEIQEEVDAVFNEILRQQRSY